MAITARFQADFSAFSQAVQKAEVQLKTFESGAAGVEKALTRMTNSFTGQRTIQEATLMAAAIERAGGITSLTARELQSAGARAAEAAEKMKKLGMEVPPELTKLAAASKSVSQSTESWSAQLSKANGLLATFGVGLSVGALVSFGKSVLSAGDQIQKMADQTGLGTAEVQKLQYISGQSGSAMGSLISAVQNLQQRLGEGNAGTIGAIKQLNINLADFSKLDSYQQMTLLAERVRGIKDPTEQAALAADLFGKNWKEILPAIKSGMEELGNQAPIMSDETIKSLDRIGDTLDDAERRVKAWGGSAVLAVEQFGFAVGDLLSRFDPEHFGVATSELLRMQAALNDPDGLAAAMQKATTTASGFAAMGIEPLKKIAEPTKAEIAALNRQLDLNREANHKALEAAKKHADELKKQREAVAALNLSNASPIVRQIYDPAAGELPGLAKLQAYAKLIDQVRGIEASIGQRGAQGIEAIGKAIPIGGLTLPKTFADYLQQDLGKVILGAVQGGGSVVQSIGSSVGSQIGTSILGDGTKGIGGFLTQNLGKTLGGALGSMIPGVGALLGPLAGAIGKGIGKLFGADGKEVNRLRDQFIGTFDSIDVLREKAYTAGISMDRLLNANKPKEMEAAIKELSAALQFQDDAMKILNETTQRYGFTIEELGPAFARQQLDQQAQQLFKDFEVLTAAGIDVDTVLGKMGGSINQFVADALRTGTEIPAAMAPMLQRMVEMGQLTDQNGNIITDLEASGVSFAMTMSQGFRDLIGEVSKLTEAIARGLGLAIENIPQPVIQGRVEWNVAPIPGNPGVTESSLDYAAHGGRVTSSGVLYAAAGAFVPRGTDTVPAMLTPGERVLSVRQNREYEGGYAALRAEMAGLRRDLRSVLPEAIGLSVRDLVLQGAR